MDKQDMQLMKVRGYKVVKANEIIQKARYDLNIIELKTLSYIFSKVRPSDTEFQDYSFSIQEYCQVCGIDYENGGNYKYIKDTLKGLRDKSFWVEENGTEILVGWLSKAGINKGSGMITVRLDNNMQKYLLGILKNYTQYELLLTLPMKSAYSFRIYELLKSYSFAKEHTFDIDDLKEKLSCQNYGNFKDFRRRVLEPAIAEINTYTDLCVRYEPVKMGKRFAQVTFFIGQKDTKMLIEASKTAYKELSPKTKGKKG